MKEEIEAAARFLTLLVSRSHQSAVISEEQLGMFKRNLVRLFEERFHVSGSLFRLNLVPLILIDSMIGSLVSRKATTRSGFSLHSLEWRKPS